MVALDRAVAGALAAAPGSTARQVRDVLARKTAARQITRKEVNSHLYRGLQEGHFVRSDDQRPRWWLADEAGVRTAVELPIDIEALIGLRLPEVATSLGVPLGGGKLATRRIGEQIASRMGWQEDETTLRVVRIDDRGRPAEDVQLGSLAFGELIATCFADSPVRRTLSDLRFILFSRTVSLADSRLLSAVRWAPEEDDLRGMGRDYERARAAIADSDLSALPSGGEVTFLRYGTKGVDRTDVQALPDGSVAPRRGFYLVKRALTPILAAATETGIPLGNPAVPSPNAALLFDVLRESLGD